MSSDSDDSRSQELRQRIKSEEPEQYEKEPLSEKETEEQDDIAEQPPMVCERQPKVTVYRAVQQPSFITRQFRNITNFFVELFEFILLL